MDKAKKLRDAVRRLIVAQGTFDETKRPCGAEMSAPHAYALLVLLQGGAMTVSALAAQLSIDRTNVSRLCARMEEAGELVRARHPEDARARLLQLTTHGEKVARRIDASSAAHFERLLSLLDKQSDTVIDALHVLLQALNQMKDPA
jgi:DNA-binding MarR family transcriptional regulator